MALTKLAHPDDPKTVIEVEEERVALYKASGWAEPQPKSDKK